MSRTINTEGHLAVIKADSPVQIDLFFQLLAAVVLECLVYRKDFPTYDLLEALTHEADILLDDAEHKTRVPFALQDALQQNVRQFLFTVRLQISNDHAGRLAFDDQTTLRNLRYFQASTHERYRFNRLPARKQQRIRNRLTGVVRALNKTANQIGGAA